jgi:tetratricopeptide (TPR) repeat protein
MTSSTDKRRPKALAFFAIMAVGVFALGVAGCASKQVYEEVDVPPAKMSAYLADKPPALRPMFEQVLRQGRRNVVLNRMQAGLAALEWGAYEPAEVALEKVLLSIETVYAGDETAARARSLWYAEGAKDFKGEPYERAMAYYYRGLLFLRRGDYENARASFKGGQLQDTLAEEKQYRMDFALLVFLEGWASHLLGDHGLAEEAFDEVKALRPEFVAPEPGDNVLVIAETGTAPAKIAVGRGDAALQLVRGRGFLEDSVGFHAEALRIAASKLEEDIYWQASTRGGRQIDHILAGKVQFKERSQEMGRALTEVSIHGLLAAPAFGKNADKAAIAAGIIGILGLTQQALSSATKTEADTRAWNNLPDKVHVTTFQSEPKDLTVGVSFYDLAGAEIRSLKKSAPVEFVDRHSGLAWVRSQSALPN